MKHTEHYLVRGLTSKNDRIHIAFDHRFNTKSEALAKYKECKQKHPRVHISLFAFYWNPITQKWVYKENESTQSRTL